MKRPKIQEFKEYVDKYPKMVGLKLMYREFNVREDKDKQKFRDLWDLIATKEMTNEKK